MVRIPQQAAHNRLHDYSKFRKHFVHIDCSMFPFCTQCTETDCVDCSGGYFARDTDECIGEYIENLSAAFFWMVLRFGKSHYITVHCNRNKMKPIVPWNQFIPLLSSTKYIDNCVMRNQIDLFYDKLVQRIVHYVVHRKYVIHVTRGSERRIRVNVQVKKNHYTYWISHQPSNNNNHHYYYVSWFLLLLTRCVHY